MRFSRSILRLSVAALLGCASAASAQTSATDRNAAATELRGAQSDLEGSEDTRRRIEADVEAIKLDRTRLNQALIETTARIQKTESERADAGARLDKAASEAAALTASATERRRRLVDLMAAVERMAREAPPAALVKPDDMASAVRVAGVAASLIANAKTQSDELAAELARVAEAKAAVVHERDSLEASGKTLALDRQKLAALMEARQAALSDREGALAAERKRADEIAGRVANLKDLIAKMDGDAAAADAADRAAAAAVTSRAAVRGGDPARLHPAFAFSEQKGRVAFPVTGAAIKRFGDSDGAGGQSKGVSFSTAAGAIVSTPVDAWVVFAGPYRSYGQLLILNAGEGYYLVLAGMERIQVAVGQFVLAGEPVAVMGSGAARAVSTTAIGADPPVLYIEFRKNDTVIDPEPWWAKGTVEKARG